MSRSPRLSVLASLVLVAGLAACAGGSSDRSAEDIEADIAAQLEDNGYSSDAAACVAALVVEEVGAEELQDIDFNADAPPTELEEEIAAAALAAVEACEPGTDGEQ